MQTQLTRREKRALQLATGQWQPRRLLGINRNSTHKLCRMGLLKARYITNTGNIYTRRKS